MAGGVKRGGGRKAQWGTNVGTCKDAAPGRDFEDGGGRGWGGGGHEDPLVVHVKQHLA